MRQKSKGKIYIGTSGWHYLHWRGPFYPVDLSPNNFLEYYTRHFRTVEINNTFYRLPEARAFNTWRDKVPTGFVFAVKASRFITHVKRLKDPATPTANFVERAKILGDKLGPVLFLIPPKWNLNTERLRGFLDILPSGFRYAFEFRDTSWFDDAVNDLLKEHNAAFCIYDFAGTQSPLNVTADFVYIRLHGPEETAYSGRYTDKNIADRARFINDMSEEGKDIYCYFDNDEAGYAVQDAMKLIGMTKYYR